MPGVDLKVPFLVLDLVLAMTLMLLVLAGRLTMATLAAMRAMVTLAQHPRGAAQGTILHHVHGTPILGTGGPDQYAISG